MFCRFCGKQVDDGSKFCRFCGKQFGEPDKPFVKLKPKQETTSTIKPVDFCKKLWEQNPKKILNTACVVVIAVCLIGLIRSGESNSDTYYPSQLSFNDSSHDTSDYSDKDYSEDYNSDSGESSSQSTQNASSQPGTYSVTSQIDGSTLTVKPGQCATIYKHVKYAEGDGRATVQLPEMEAYSQGMFLRTNCYINQDGQYEYSYIAKNGTREKYLDMMKKYHDLLADYSVMVTLETSYDGTSGYAEWHGGDYVGSVNITPNSVTGYRENFDLAFFFDYTFDYTYIITCPEEITFVDFGDRCDGTKDPNLAIDKVFQYTSSFSSEMTDNGDDAYILGGWNPDKKGDKVRFVLNPDMYEKGEEFGLDYFVNPSDNACSFSFTVYGTETTDFWISYVEGKERFKDASVKILEKSDAVTAISFYICYRNRVGDDCILEGIFAIQTGDAYYVDDAENSGQGDSGGLGIGNSGTQCTHCGGDGDAEDFCTRCSGNGEIDCRDCFNGKEDCTRCGGDGDVYDSLNGRETDCFSCTGGKVRCSTCNGNGSIRCNQCNDGKKIKDCILCGGDGEL